MFTVYSWTGSSCGAGSTNKKPFYGTLKKKQNKTQEQVDAFFKSLSNA